MDLHDSEIGEAVVRGMQEAQAAAKKESRRGDDEWQNGTVNPERQACARARSNGRNISRSEPALRILSRVSAEMSEEARRPTHKGPVSFFPKLRCCDSGACHNNPLAVIRHVFSAMCWAAFFLPSSVSPSKSK